jgi:hypothetical protein
VKRLGATSFLGVIAALASCGSSAPAGSSPSPRGHAPLVFERIALPAPAVSAWASPRGGGVVALRTGARAFSDPEGTWHVEDLAAPAKAPAQVGSDKGSGWTWLARDGAIERTDGTHWEELARGLSLGSSPQIAVEANGAAALVIDGSGSVWEVAADEALRVVGFDDGAHVTDTRLPLEALSIEGTKLDKVDYFIDDERVATRTTSPWGWGTDGARTRDAGEMSFGAHVVRVDAHTARGGSFSSTLHVTYASPIGRVPTYAADIAPLFRAHCASCHDHAIARDLATYERLRAMVWRSRASVRQGRMPPDLGLDPAAVTLFTAWCDGATPP